MLSRSVLVGSRSFIATILALAIALTTMTPVSAMPAQKADRIGEWTIEARTEADGTRVERARFNNVVIESRITGSVVTTTIQTPDLLEVVVSDQNSPVYTITTNGKTKAYNREAMQRFHPPPKPAGRIPYYLSRTYLGVPRLSHRRRLTLKVQPY